MKTNNRRLTRGRVFQRILKSLTLDKLRSAFKFVTPERPTQKHVHYGQVKKDTPRHHKVFEFKKGARFELISALDRRHAEVIVQKNFSYLLS